MTNLNNLKSSTIKYLPCVVSDSRCINHNPGKPPICTVRVSTAVSPLKGRSPGDYRFGCDEPILEIEEIVEIPYEIYEKIKDYLFRAVTVKLKKRKIIEVDFKLDGIPPVKTTKKKSFKNQTSNKEK